MSRSALILFLAALFGGTSLLALEAKLPRHPAPSPDGSQIAFSWQGDLWLVAADGGEARRLTAHPASERFPIWSRDGHWLVFSSNRHGNPDVFAMKVDGSEAPRRLTYVSRGDRPLDISPDGTRVLFSSARGESIRRSSALYTVSFEGGTPAQLLPALAQRALWSPDGESLLLVRGGTPWQRRGYRGSANRDLWLWHSSSDEYRQLTEFDGDDDLPSWIDDQRVAFLSSRSGRKNLFLLDIASGETRQLTHHDGSAVRYPRAAATGGLIAYEFEDGLWTVTADGGEPRRLQIDVPADSVRNRLEARTDQGGADELAVSPDGERVAVVVRGEVFVTDVTSAEDQAIAAAATARVTDTVAAEADLSWSPDGKNLLFTSSRDGQRDLYLARPADEDASWSEAFEFVTTRLTDSPQDEHSASFSPDGERIAFLRGRGDLMTMKTDGSDEKALTTHWEAPAYRWSPDGRWIAYSQPDESYNTEIWLLPAEGGTPYNVSRHPDDDHSPRWSPDGKRLVWLSRRHGNTFDLWSVWLAQEDHERTPAEWLKLWKEQESSEKDEGENGKKGEKDDDAKSEEKEAEELPEVTIDFDGLWRRSQALTAFQGDEGPALVSKDGKSLFFNVEREDETDLYRIRWDGGEPKALTEGGSAPRQLQIAGEGSELFYLDRRGTVRRMSKDGDPGDPVPFTARYTIDHRAEADAVFEEAWRALDLYFYDPDFHGVDWAAQRDKYRPWALAAADPEDFSDVVNLMLGELNASHMGYGQFSGDDDAADRTGWIGAVFDPAAGGPGLRVREVLPESPAARKIVGLTAGERLIAVGGEPIAADTNVYRLFNNTVGQRLPLRIRSATGEERTAVVVPTSFRSFRQQRYRLWTEQRRQIVDRLSEGRLGYLHILGMNMASFEDFERDLFAAGEGKEGLLIDVRSNGGGWTTDYLMAVLNVRRHARTVPRGADPTLEAYPQSRLPLAAWTRPAATLCDEESYSNAEIFSYAFQTLERGPVIGYPTFGAVISTGGTGLLNGGFVRLPTRGWFVAGSDINMENNGAVPDIVVRRPPQEDTASDEDSQLARAVEELLQDIEEDPRYGSW